MALRIMQYNCRNFRCAKAELMRAITRLRPQILSIQETWLQDGEEAAIPGYCVYRKDRPQGKRGGGVMVAVSNMLAVEEINLKQYEGIDLLGLDIYVCKRKIRLINTYMPPGTLREPVLKYVLSLLSGDFIVTGDFNAHHQRWDRSTPNVAGRIIAKALEAKKGIAIANTGQPTYIPSLKVSAPDLTFVPEAQLRLTKWNPTLDLGSDHFAIMITVTYIPGLEERLRMTSEKRYINEEELEKRKYAIYNLEKDLFSLWEDFLDEFNEIMPVHEKRVEQKRVKAIRQDWWYTQECYQRKIRRRAASRKLRQSPTAYNLIQYRKEAALARKEIRKAKKEAWQHFCSNLTPSVNPKHFWATIRSLNRKTKAPIQILPLQTGQGGWIDDLDEKLEALVEGLFPGNDVSTEIAQTDARRVAGPRRNNVDPECDREFNRDELRIVIDRLNKTSAPGPDRMSNKFLKRIPYGLTELVLAIINGSWNNGTMPEEWRSGEVIPIRKPGKKGTMPSHYRPITLLNAFAKIVQALVNNRLNQIMKTKQKWSPIQCGGRKGHSLYDPAIRLHSAIEKAKKERRTLIAMCFDIKQAYDSVQSGEVSEALQDHQISGKLERWINSFMTRRNVRVRCGGKVSRNRVLTIGIPQGSPLSGTIFNLTVNDLGKVVDKETTGQFLDDIAAWETDEAPLQCKRDIESRALEVECWANKKGLSLNQDKTQILVVSPEPCAQELAFEVGGKELRAAPAIKYLGIVFTAKKMGVEHIKQQIKKAKNYSKVIPQLKSKSWGVTTDDALKVCNAVIIPTLLFGVEIFEGIPKYANNWLQVIQNKALRAATQLPRDTRISDLHYITKVTPVRTKLEMQVARRLIERAVSTEWCKQTEWGKEIDGKWRHQLTLPQTNKRMISTKGGEQLHSDKGPPRLVEGVMPFQKVHNPTIRCEGNFELWINQYQGWDKIFTDGSVTEKGAAACMYHQRSGMSRTRKIKKWHTSTDTELLAIALALEWTNEHKQAKTVILTDSMAAKTMAVQGTLDERDTIQCLLSSYIWLAERQNLQVEINWVPAHSGIKGNEIADKMAKEAANEDKCKELELFAYKSAKRTFTAMLRDQVMQDWRATPANNGLRACLPTQATEREFWRTFNKADSRTKEWLTLVFTNKAKLNENRWRWNQAKSPECLLCSKPAPKETVEHRLMWCEGKENERKEAKELAHSKGVAWTFPGVFFNREITKIMMKRFTIGSLQGCND